MTTCVSVDFHALEAFEAVMEDAGGGIEANVLIGKDPRLMPPMCFTPFDLKHMICIEVSSRFVPGAVMGEGRIGLAGSGLPVTYFPKAKSWAGGIVEGWSVLATCRQEASSLAGDEGCGLTTAKGGDDNSIPGAMVLRMASKEWRPCSSYQSRQPGCISGLTRGSGRTTMHTTEHGRRTEVTQPNSTLS